MPFYRSHPRHFQPPAPARSREEAKQALQDLTDAQHHRLQAAARKIYVPSLARLGYQPIDLLQEAMCRTLSGQRRWRSDLPLPVHLRSCMRSLVASLLKNEADQPLLACEVEKNECSRHRSPRNLQGVPLPVEPAQPEEENPAVLLVRRRLKEHGAYLALSIFEMLLRGDKPRVIQRNLRLSRSSYSTQWQRLQRCARHSGTTLASLRVPSLVAKAS